MMAITLLLCTHTKKLGDNSSKESFGNGPRVKMTSIKNFLVSPYELLQIRQSTSEIQVNIFLWKMDAIFTMLRDEVTVEVFLRVKVMKRIVLK